MERSCDISCGVASASCWAALLAAILMGSIFVVVITSHGDVETVCVLNEFTATESETMRSVPAEDDLIKDVLHQIGHLFYVAVKEVVYVCANHNKDDTISRERIQRWNHKVLLETILNE